MTEQDNRTETQSSLRVSVDLLDTLMNLAGELVLSRNQLLQGLASADIKAMEAPIQRIDLITSELQEAVMQTRMQPIGNIFNKLNRIVRDLSLRLDKSVNLVLEGNDVELDKTILESVDGPLTRLVENAVEHHIERPGDRTKAGKSEEGVVKIRAFHDAGQVHIVVSDDGKGLNPFEAADKAGQGPGMAGVTEGIESLGGVMESDAAKDLGTQTQIKLPLTLAIIPSQIARVGQERFAIPQVNLNELLRIPVSEIKNRIERVGDAEVVRLRGELLPLLNLAKMLDIPRAFVDPKTGEAMPEKRENIADRRAVKHIVHGNGAVVQAGIPSDQQQQREPGDRRKYQSRAVNIAVVSAGALKYGLVLDRFHDSEEIVVKPVGRHLKQCREYAGATIMGDGKVALILDIANIGNMAKLSTVSESAQAVKATEALIDEGKDSAALLMFKNGDSEYFAAPLNRVERLERIRPEKIETVGNTKVVQYKKGALQLYELSDIGPFSPLPEREYQEVVVFRAKDGEIGLMVTPPVDALEVVMDVDEATLKQNGVSGSMTIKGHTTLLLDIDEMARHLNPDRFTI